MKRYSVAVVQAPAVEPITRAEAKLHLRVDTDDTEQDDLIDGLIAAAAEWVENYCRRSLVKRTLALRLDCFPEEILLPRGPVQSVSSIEYVDSGGNTATLSADAYQVDSYSTPARIRPVFGGVWPTVKSGTLNAVVVTYIAGYVTDASPLDLAEIPSAVKAAMKLLISHWYENREAVAMNAAPTEVPLAVKHLLAAYEIRDFRLE